MGRSRHQPGDLVSASVSTNLVMVVQPCQNSTDPVLRERYCLRCSKAGGPAFAVTIEGHAESEPDTTTTVVLCRGCLSALRHLITLELNR
jgi:hypothetical protein